MHNQNIETLLDSIHSWDPYYQSKVDKETWKPFPLREEDVYWNLVAYCYKKYERRDWHFIAPYTNQENQALNKLIVSATTGFENTFKSFNWDKEQIDSLKQIASWIFKLFNNI